MALGPGKYDELAEYCIHKVNARAVVVIVFDGDRGSIGISGKELVHGAIEYEIACRSGGVVQRKLATVLRHIAKTVEDRKSTRLNSSHQIISYAVFSLKKKTTTQPLTQPLPTYLLLP